jgi:hypothetical protein
MASKQGAVRTHLRGSISIHVVRDLEVILLISGYTLSEKYRAINIVTYLIMYVKKNNNDVHVSSPLLSSLDLDAVASITVHVLSPTFLVHIFYLRSSSSIACPSQLSFHQPITTTSSTI